MGCWYSVVEINMSFFDSDDIELNIFISDLDPINGNIKFYSPVSSPCPSPLH